MRKNGIVFILVGGLFLVIGGVLPYLVFVLTPDTSSVGIIGGADSEILRLISSRVLHNIDLSLKMFGGAFGIMGIVCVLFGDRLHSHCTRSSTILTVGFSASFSFCAFCGLSFGSCFFLTNPAKHPIRLPLSLILGVIGAGILVLLLDRYIKLRKIHKSVLGVIADIGMVFLFFVPFVILFSSIESILS